LHFYYDADGKPSHVQLNDTRFFYQYNLQGDVIGILAGGHTQVVRYEYDAWGKVMSYATLPLPLLLKEIARETERYKYKYTASWTNVDAQYNYFKNSGLTQEPLVLNANNHLTEGAGTIQTADLIYFCDQGGLDPNHAGIVYDIDSSGQILYSGHTKSRLDRKLSLYFEACPDANVIVLRWID